MSDEEIKGRFFALCGRLRWGVTDVARELEVDQGSVSQWKKDRKIPRHYLAAIADRAGETMAYFAPQPADEPVRVDRRDKLVIATWLEECAARLRAEALGVSPAEGGRAVAEQLAELERVEGALRDSKEPARKRGRRQG